MITGVQMIAPVSLCDSMKHLAGKTWTMLEDSHRLNLSIGEETITELRLLELAKAHPSEVAIHSFNRQAEAKTGADWEWFFEGHLWFGMRVQAKRLDYATQRYKHLQYVSSGRVNPTRQVDLLLAAAKKTNLYPAYCFYSAWNLTTSPFQMAQVPGVPFNCDSNPPSESLIGCSIASAYDIHALVNAKKDALIDVMKVAYPWSCLVCCGGVHGSDAAERTANLLKYHEDVSPERSAWPARRRPRKDTGILSEPPKYVSQILEGKSVDTPPAGVAGVVVIRNKRG